MATSDGPSPALKLIVYSMGIALVGGMILLAVLVMQKLKDGTLLAKDQEAAEVVEMPLAASCNHTQIDMQGRGALQHAELEGQKLSLWFEAAPGQHQLVVVDSCSGALVREVDIKTSQ